MAAPSARIGRYDNVDRVEIDADHYGFPVETGRDRALRTIADWISTA